MLSKFTLSKNSTASRDNKNPNSLHPVIEYSDRRGGGRVCRNEPSCRRNSHLPPDSFTSYCSNML